MITPKQKELIYRMVSITKDKKIIWDKYLTPKSFVYKQSGFKYIISNYTNTTDHKIYDCISFLVVDGNGKPYESCIACNDDEYMVDYNELKTLFNAVVEQYTQNEDREIGFLLELLPE